jgi:uncharacterized protein YjbI with pentapeptide repeats
MIFPEYPRVLGFRGFRWLSFLIGRAALADILKKLDVGGSRVATAMAISWQLRLSLICIALLAPLSHGSIHRWDTQQVIPGTEGVFPVPGAQLDHLALQYANLRDRDLNGASFEEADLSHADLTSANLRKGNLLRTNLAYATLRYTKLVDANLTAADLSFTDLWRADLTNANLTDANLAAADLQHVTFNGADFSGAIVTGVNLSGRTRYGFTPEQLYSTRSYQDRDLQGINLNNNDLSGWDFSGQNLSTAGLQSSLLGGANLAGATIRAADFRNTTSGGLTPQQFYSTRSHQENDLRNIELGGNDLSGWDFRGQNLSNASFFGWAGNAVYRGSTLANADFTDAIIDGTEFDGTTAHGFTAQQLYSTRSYQLGDLRKVRLSNNDLSEWDFSNQELTGATLRSSNIVDADFTGAIVRDANLPRTVTKEQLYSTQSYRILDLHGIGLEGADLREGKFSRGFDLTRSTLASTDLTNADLTDANLTGASLSHATLVGADLTDAVVRGAWFYQTTTRGFTKEQLYSTASYEKKNLEGIDLGRNSLRGWDFSGQDLSCANLGSSSLNGTDFSAANLTNARLDGSTLTDSVLKGARLANADLSDTDPRSAMFDETTTYNQWTTFPPGFDPVESGWTMIMSLAGDFNANGVLDANDVDMLATRTRHGRPWWLSAAIFDLNRDSDLDQKDRRVWVEDLKQTYFGDANLDGEFNSSDMVFVFRAGKFEDSEPRNADWEEGDWTGDGDFDTSDMVLAFQGGGYEKGPRTEIETVPEPVSWSLFVFGLLPWLCGWRTCQPMQRP